MTDPSPPVPSLSTSDAPEVANASEPTPRVFRDRRMPRFAPTWVGFVAFLLAVTLAITAWWWAHPHMMAASVVALHGGSISWDWSEGKWQHGGDSTVDMSSAARQLKDADLAALKNVHRLVSLNLAQCFNLSDEGLSVLRELPYLEDLTLSRAVNASSYSARPGQITDATLKNIKGLHRLQMLNLAGTSISDAGLQELKGLKNLYFLDLSDTNVSDQGLLALKGLPRLRTLIVDSPKVTPQGSAVLLQTNPNLDIQHPLTSKIEP